MLADGPRSGRIWRIDPGATAVSVPTGPVETARGGGSVSGPSLRLQIRAAELGIAVDPGFSFVFLGTYQRLARCWALVVSGGEPDATETAIREATRLIAANFLDPPRSCVATWYALLGEMHLAAGSIDEAAAALDRADFYLNAYGQRTREGLLLLLRARLLHERGENGFWPNSDKRRLSRVPAAANPLTVHWLSRPSEYVR